MKRGTENSKATVLSAILLLITALIPLNSLFAQTEQYSGTGFALSPEGYIATAAHVIEDAALIKVIGIEGNHSISYNARVVACDLIHDVAIIKVEDARFSTLGAIPYVIKEKGVGLLTDCFIMGYPETSLLDTTLKATSGQVNGIQETKYQYDAASQHGNSGSPLFSTEDGTVIGVVVSRITESESGNWWGTDIVQNANFASKISYVRYLADSLGIKLPTVSQMKGRSSDMAVQAAPFVYRIVTNNILSTSLLLSDYPTLNIRNLKELLVTYSPLIRDVFYGKAKSVTETEYNTAFKGEVEFVSKSVKSYNQQGHLLCEKQYDKYNNLLYQTDYIYDINDQLAELYVIKFELWTEEEIPIGKINLNRNSKNQIVAATSYYLLNRDTVCLQRAKVTYENGKCNHIELFDGKNQLIEKLEFLYEGNSLHTFFYDNNSEEQERTTYISNEYNQIIASVLDFDTIRYQYSNPYTNVVSKATVPYYDGAIKYTVKKFHESGEPLKILIQYEKEKMQMEYKYDKRNNWIFKQANHNYVIRDIEYY